MIDTITLVRHDLTEALHRQFAEAGVAAWDIETTGLDWQEGRIGTCQLHTPTVGTVVVQVDDDRPDRLASLLADDRVVKVFHHAPFDLRWMSSHWDTPVASVACTKVASRLLHPEAAGQEHSLRHLVADHLGVDIDKSERLSDWTLHELTPSQLRYAAGDVEYLLPLMDVLTTQLDNAGLLEVYQQCLEFLPTRIRYEVNGWADVFSY